MHNKLQAVSNGILEELNRFSDEIIYLGPPIEDDRLLHFEAKIGFSFPEDFRFIVSRHNGISLGGIEVFGLDKALRGSSMDEIYEFEHKHAGSKMPDTYLPFSPDGAGNHYCLDLSTLANGICKIVFWQHDLEYENEDQVETCNNSFSDWLQEVLIGWALEDYNYDGSPRA
ncbi:SMI1/KNR4 family protein [Dyadobacter arcticus]|uniref:Cell wall assembly regulator SMI1 n=1 Tax=Dyadobacter arcticus TaxID=1078754 RepID=A0ABX0ULN7_9BACT|nr:SMI1/KNR4 family protein [Dyadobacter arcticus]NIJ52370.1 cell wall assembly regulator SMI1 [Dyadobacter arcticus]